MSPQFWLGLQMDYDLDVTADYLAGGLKREVSRMRIEKKVRNVRQLFSPDYDKPG